MNPPAAACAALVATCCLFAAGCRTVTGAALLAPGADSRPPPRTSEAAHPTRTLPVEVRFVRHDPREAAFGAALWDHVDEQALDAGLRRRLEANGLRAGVVTGRLPADVAARLESASTIDPAAPEEVNLVRLLRLLPGNRAEVVAAAGLAELVLLEHGADGVCGATYRDATALFALQAWPDADGRVRVRIVPEVKHGVMQRSWVGEEGMFRLETGQERRDFDELGISVRLPAGGMLLVAPTAANLGAVGDALLRDRAGPDAARLLVLRPLAAGADPLFASGGDPGAVAEGR